MRSSGWAQILLVSLLGVSQWMYVLALVIYPVLMRIFYGWI